MKIKIPNYIFNPGQQTITFPNYSSMTLDSFLLITDVTQNIIIYNFADPTAGGTLLGNILTLTYNTSSLSSTDSLLVYYDDQTSNPPEATLQVLTDMVSLLKRIAEYTSVLDVTDPNQRLRVNVDAAGTSASAAGLVVSTVSSVSSCTIAATAGAIVTNGTTSANNVEWAVPDVWHNVDAARTSYANGIRANLTFN